MTTEDFRERTAVAFRPVTDLLDNGRCEPLKATVHGVLLATASLCAAYNTAAWLKRRQTHLAINAIVYTLAACWERCHVAHHLRACERLDAARPELVAVRPSPTEAACATIEPVPMPERKLTDAA